MKLAQGEKFICRFSKIFRGSSNKILYFPPINIVYEKAIISLQNRVFGRRNKIWPYIVEPRLCGVSDCPDFFFGLNFVTNIS